MAQRHRAMRGEQWSSRLLPRRVHRPVPTTESGPGRQPSDVDLLGGCGESSLRPGFRSPLEIWWSSANGRWTCS